MSPIAAAQSSLQRAHSSVRMPEQVYRSNYLADERDHVLNLALQRGVVAAIAAAAQIHGIDGEALSQFGQDEPPVQVVRCHAVHQDE